MTTSVVFFDPRVPDLARLLDGLVPGTRGYVLEPARDGLRQIAGILVREALSDLADLSLVAHGRPGAIEIGATTLDTEGLAAHGRSLAEIGASLAPGGDIKIYACSVAAEPNGRRFLAGLSQALGDVALAAASRPVGASAQGASWDLDVSIGAVASAVPFLADARQAYQGVLAVKFTKIADPVGDTGPFDNRVVFGDFDSDGDVLYQNGSTLGQGFGYKQNNGSGTFTANFIDATAAGTPFAGQSFATSQGITLFAVDINNDGRVDLVDRTANSTRVLFQNTNGTFTQAASDPIGNTGLSSDVRLTFGDFDNDGDVDILYQRSDQSPTPLGNFGYKQNQGNGNFFDFPPSGGLAGTPFAGISFANSQNVNSLFVVDLNNDGRVDLVERTPASSGGSNPSSAYPSNLRVLQQNANGTFTQLAMDPIEDTGAFPNRLAFGDFDSDGDVDILYQVGNTAGSGIGYKQNNGNGAFADFPNAASAGTPFAGVDFSGRQIFPNSIFVEDLDRDGDVDIIDRTVNSTAYFQQGSDNPAADGSPPTLTSSTPADNATGVSPTANLVLTFDEAVFKGSAGNIQIVKVSDGSIVQTIAVSGSAVTVSGNTVSIAHTALAQNTAYAIRVDSGAFVDSDGAVYAGIRGTDTTTLNFTTIANQVPVVTPSGGVTAASEQTPVAVDTALTLMDADSTTLASANVAITGNFRSGEDVLAFTNTGAAAYGNVAASYVGGVLTLTSAGATATVAQFEAALRAVTYTDTSDTPNTGNRTITFTANDGSGSSVAVTKTVSVAAVNDAPVATASIGTTAANEQIPVAVDAALTVWSAPTRWSEFKVSAGSVSLPRLAWPAEPVG